MERGDENAKPVKRSFRWWGVGVAVLVAGLAAAAYRGLTAPPVHERASLPAHVSSVNGIAFSPDGSILATIGNDPEVKLWDTSTGVQRAGLRGHDAALYGVTFSPDGRTLATGGLETHLRLWDVVSQKEPDGDSHCANGERLAFSPDGHALAIATGDVFNPDFASDLYLADTRTGALGPALGDHRGIVRSLAFTPDGRTLVSGGWEGQAVLWDVAHRKKQQALQHAGGVTAVAVAADGHMLATGAYDRVVRLWELPSGQPRGELKGHPGGVTSVAFRPGKNQLASADGDGWVKLWDLSTLAEKWSLRANPFYTSAVAFSPDGHTLATARGGVLIGTSPKLEDVKLWELPSAD